MRGYCCEMSTIYLVLGFDPSIEGLVFSLTPVVCAPRSSSCRYLTIHKKSSIVPDAWITFIPDWSRLAASSAVIADPIPFKMLSKSLLTYHTSRMASVSSSSESPESFIT